MYVSVYLNVGIAYLLFGFVYVHQNLDWIPVSLEKVNYSTSICWGHKNLIIRNFYFHLPY